MTIVAPLFPDAQCAIKQCNRCCFFYSTEFFSKNKRSKDKLSCWCKNCRAEYARLYRVKSKEKIRSKQRDLRYKESYGISLEDYNKILKKQNGKCACCGSTNASKSPHKWQNFCVDHCHVTGKVRGLLCNSCNIGVGKLGDNLDGVLNAALYLSLSEGRKDAESAIREMMQNVVG